MVTTEDKIEWAVKRLHNHCSGGLSGMKAEHMKRWLASAGKLEKYTTATTGSETTENKGTTAFKTSMEPTEAVIWEMVVDLIQTAFRERKLAEEATW